MDENAAQIYEKLLELTKATGDMRSDIMVGMQKIQGDIEGIRAEVQRNYARSEENDRLSDERITEIEAELTTKIDNHDKRIAALEGKKAKELVKWYDKLRDWAIWGALIALVGFLIAQVKGLASTIIDLSHMMPPPPSGI